ncbi:MAG: hypothetical protein KDC98_23230 [Planctomycetes bacterium]|nr:hypothetical protein [Planctomycetota bacterium]
MDRTTRQAWLAFPVLLLPYLWLVRRFWFVCDDAFINYRFCGNAHDGHGFVWNPAPFAPVEGYTSFLWVFGLYLVWIATGIEPPDAAIPIAFCSGILVLWFIGGRLAELAMSERSRRWQPLVTLVALCAVASNHTFATWLTSGMETSVFALFAVLWTLRATRVAGDGGAGLLLLSIWAVMAYLVRPDGMLLVLGTVAIGCHGWLRRQRRLATVLASLLPNLVVVAHFLWRRSYYGEWLPNTYYAKVTQAWPESGLRYLFCFAIEHGLWLWLPLVVLWLVVAACRRGAVASLFADRWPALVAVSAWIGFVGYYTLVVGGDHFAYRIFAHLVPLVVLAACAMAASLRIPAIAVAIGMTLFGIAANVPGWWLEAQLVGREAEGFARTVTRAPQWLRPVLVHYDRNQAWLLLHSVGFRRATHDVLCQNALRGLPDRHPGYVAGATAGQRLIYRADAVGVTGWALCDVAILDGHGLCDWVIARNKKAAAEPPNPLSLREAFGGLDGDRDGRLRTPELEASAHLLGSIGPGLQPATWAELMLSLGDCDDDDALDADELVTAVTYVVPPRHMAHEREPPEGYIEAFRPNVAHIDGRLRVRPEVQPLSDEELRAVEQRYRATVGR